MHTFDDAELTAFANQIKDLLSIELELPELDKVVLIIAKPSILGRFKGFMRGFISDDQEKTQIIVLADKLKGLQ